MRVAMISDVYFPRVNGVSTSIRTFRQELVSLGHHVTLIAPEYPQTSDDDADIVRIPSRVVPLDEEDRMMKGAQLRAMQRSLRQQPFDIVHIQTPFAAHYAGLKLARALRVPAVISYHTFFEEYLHHYVPFVPSACTRFLARRFTVSQCNAAQRIIAPSQEMRDVLVNYGVRAEIDILPTGLEPAQFTLGDRDRFRARHGISSARPLLLFVGRVAHEKNIDFLLTLMPLVLSRVPEALLVIAGEGPAQHHLQSLARALGIQASVQFIGYLDRETELLDCYRAADLFLFASRTETQGLVLLEAMAQGTPVVATAHMGTRAILEHARSARVVAEDKTQFAHAVGELLQNPAERGRLASLAQDDARRWSSREMAERMVRCYAAAMKQAAPASDIRAHDMP